MVLRARIDVEHIEDRLAAISSSDDWQAVVRKFEKATFIRLIGNGGNMAVADHASADIGRLTDKNAAAASSATTTTSFLSEAGSAGWATTWLMRATRGLNMSQVLTIGFSCSEEGPSVTTVVGALNWCVGAGGAAVLIAANDAHRGQDPRVITIRQRVRFYHTSELLSLALMYELCENSGFRCPEIKTSTRARDEIAHD